MRHQASVEKERKLRTLLLFRGAPGCGKSTYIEQNGLKPYTLSADDLRLLYNSKTLLPNGLESVNQSHNAKVWKTLHSILEHRMQAGEFTVIDSTNSTAKELNKYKQMARDYRYRVFCVDFTDVLIEEVKRRNACREDYKVVPSEVIDRMYNNFAAQSIPSYITVLKPDELEKIWIKPLDFSKYSRVHHIGDIHGCNTVLREYLSNNGNLNIDEMYIFTGDYIDRGIENAEILNFLCEISTMSNVILLEGNHEIHLWRWAYDKEPYSKEFNDVTRLALEDADIDKKTVRQFYRRLAQCCYYRYRGKTVLVTHGGISRLPEHTSLTKIATEQMIHGVGKYGDMLEVNNSFKYFAFSDCYQIHGHRNLEEVDIQVNETCFNLEGQVEAGGDLRCLQLDENGFTPVKTKNNIFRTRKVSVSEADTSVSTWVSELQNNKYIKEKKFGNISSFNFTRKAFNKRYWDEQTTKARGLYINTHTNKIVARSYDKFFNVGERPDTLINTLQNKLSFPVAAYQKENGFIGIVGYDEESDELVVTSKSSITGDHAGYFKSILYSNINDIDALKEYIKMHNESLLFECIDPIRDPHIIEYSACKVVLLDIVKNKKRFEKLDYSSVVKLATNLGIQCKEKTYTLNTWDEFMEWYAEITEPEYRYCNNAIEGFVIEDANGFMNKIKLDYYNYWKWMRIVADATLRNGSCKKENMISNPTELKFYHWLKELYQRKNNGEIFETDIISLRNMYYKEIR